MKNGLAVGIATSLALIVLGAAACMVGVVTARNNGQSLFTEKKDGGTYYSAQIPDSVTRLRIGVDSADISVVGGAEQSKIEFYNFNPNYYSLSVMQSAITFEEVSDLKSMVNIWERGLTFKGLRYALDIRNFSDNGERRRITVSLSEGCSLKAIDISAADGGIDINNISVSGDINISANSGEISVNNTETKTSLSVIGESINTTVNDSTSDVFRYSATDSHLDINGSEFADAVIIVGAGRVDFRSNVSFDSAAVTAVTEAGGILVNSKPQPGDYVTELEEYDRSLHIKTVSGGINIEFPSNKTDQSESE